MRIVLTSLPVYSHLAPMMVPVAQALQSAGHEVAVATGPSMEGTLAGAGVRHLVMPHMLTAEELMAEPAFAREIGLDRELAGTKDTTPQDPGAVFGRLFAGLLAQRSAGDMLAAARAYEPDLVVRETCEFGGHLLAAALGVPCATLDIAPLATVRHPGMLPTLNESRAVFGLPPIGDVTELMSRPWISWAPGAWYSGDVRGTVRSYRAPEPPAQALDPVIADLLRPAGRPFVLTTLGSNTGTALAAEDSPMARIVEALGSLPCTAVVALGADLDPADWTGPRPGNVHLAGFVQQQQLLPACDLFVTHAGFNGVRESLAAGVPMVALPLYAEQPRNAARLAELGAGIAVETEEADAKSLAAAFGEVLDDPSFRRAAQGLQRDILALPGMDALVADLTTAIPR